MVVQDTGIQPVPINVMNTIEMKRLWVVVLFWCFGGVFVDGSDATPPQCTSDNQDPTCAPSKHVVFVSIAIRGHALPLLRIASAMKERGYRVSFATHESGKEWVHSYGLPFISAGTFPISAEDLRSKLKAMTRDASTFRGILTMFNDIYVASARPMYDALLPQLNSSGNTPDLIVMDMATIGAQDLVHQLKIPYIINSPSILFDIGTAPSYIPAWGTGFSVHMSLWNRCMNILFPRLLSVALTPPFMQLNKDRYELELRPYRSQHDVFRGARVLLNTAVGLDHAQPLSPMVDAIGPILPLRPSREEKPLSAAMESWMMAKEAVVYLNLGTMSYVDVWQAEALVDGLVLGPNEPPIKVLWVLPTDQRGVLPSNMPSNFKIKSPSHVAHLSVLAHPSVRLVISHCGMVSAQEALVYQKPLVCIPFMVDQPDVAARVADAGAGLVLDKNRLTAADVHDATITILTNVTFARAAARVGRLLERAGGTNRAIEVIHGALEYGYAHLETLDLQRPWHKTVLLDVWTVYAAIFCLLAVVVRLVWLILYFVGSEVGGFVSQVVMGAPPPMALSSADHVDGTEKPNR